MHRFSVDPALIFRERVEGRRRIYLDTNAWSDLSEGRTTSARRAYDLALSLHHVDATVFPLGYPTIAELIRREINADSARQAEVMDLLSRGVCLRGYDHVIDLEVLSAFAFMTKGMSGVPLSEIFTVLVCYISDREIPAVGAAGSSGVLKVTYPPLRWIQEHMRTPEVLNHEARTDARYVSETSRKVADASNWGGDRSGRLNAKTLFFEEHTAALTRYVFPRLERLVGVEGYALIYEHLQQHVTKAAGPGAASQVVSAMPSVALSCRMNVQRVLARARTRKQDYFDHEHAARAIPYVDAFVTSDGGLLDLIRRSKTTEAYRCTILRGMEALVTYLEVLG
jgi:hypothetical protein